MEEPDYLRAAREDPAHPSKCKGFKRRTVPPQPCGLWGEKQRGGYCKWHGRRLPSFRNKTLFYNNNASVALRDKLKEVAAQPELRHNLSAEIDIMRVTAQEAVRLYDITCIQNADNKAVSAEMKAKATANVKQAMQDISAIVMNASRIRAMDQTTVEIEAINYVVSQVVQIIEKCVIDEHAKIAIKEEIREIRLPQTGNKTGAQAAAEDIRGALAEMEETVPVQAIEEVEAT